MLPFTTDPSPSPTPADIPTEPWEASPGVEGFLLGFFVLGIALALLMWSMNRHLRKIKHAQTSEQNRIAAERAGSAADRTSAGSPDRPAGERAVEDPPDPERDS